MPVTLKNSNTRCYNPPVLEQDGEVVSIRLPARGSADVPAWYAKRLVSDYAGWAKRITVGPGGITDGSELEVRERYAGQADTFERRYLDRLRQSEEKARSERDALRAQLDALLAERSQPKRRKR